MKGGPFNLQPTPYTLHPTRLEDHNLFYLVPTFQFLESGTRCAGRSGSWRRSQVARPNRCRPNVPQVRQSRPDYGLGFRVQVFRTSDSVQSSLSLNRDIFQFLESGARWAGRSGSCRRSIAITPGATACIRISHQINIYIYIIYIYIMDTYTSFTYIDTY